MSSEAIKKILVHQAELKHGEIFQLNPKMQKEMLLEIAIEMLLDCMSDRWEQKPKDL